MSRFNLVLLILVILAGCKSTKQSTTQVYQVKDSTAYREVTTVDLDTLKIDRDTASFDAAFNLSEDGNVIIEEIRQSQGDDVRIDYQVIRKPEGGAVVKVKAITKPREVITASTTKEVSRESTREDTAIVVSEKKVVRNFNWWNLAWIIPVGLVVLVVYLKRKTILGFFT